MNPYACDISVKNNIFQALILFLFIFFIFALANPSLLQMIPDASAGTDKGRLDITLRSGMIPQSSKHKQGTGRMARRLPPHGRKEQLLTEAHDQENIS